MRLLLPPFLALLQTFTFGQVQWTEAVLVPDRAIRLSPLHLLNFYPTAQVSYEHALAPRFSTLLEFGYVLPYNSLDKSFENKRGVKLKLQGRYYFDPRPGRRKVYYTALAPYTNAINFDRSRSVVECFDLACDHRYRRAYRYKMEYRETGIAAKAGVIRYMGMRFFLDINAGITLRRIRYESPGILLPPEEPDFFFQIPNESNRTSLGPNLGLRIGYRLK